MVAADPKLDVNIELSVCHAGMSFRRARMGCRPRIDDIALIASPFLHSHRPHSFVADAAA
jgi:hypothetical protein